MVLVDTSVWIDYLRGISNPAVLRLDDLLEEEADIYTTGILLQEVLSGIKERKKRDEIRNDFSRFILVMPSLETHLRAAEIYDGCRKKGITIRSLIDCLVASLALERDLSILDNDRDYLFISRIFPLRLETKAN